jgi:hypothetical protein
VIIIADAIAGLLSTVFQDYMTHDTIGAIGVSGNRFGIEFLKKDLGGLDSLGQVLHD